MNKEDFLRTSYYYDLPESLIAQKPAEPRDTSKLMLINREKDTIEHKQFKNILEYLNSGDTIVLNNTRVIPARLHGRKNGEGAFVEVFLVREISKDTWLTLAKPGKRLKYNTKIVFPCGLEGVVKETLPEGEKIITFNYDNSKSFMEIIKEIGEMPLPPYITKPECEEERYQTVYSEKDGSVAAPTAGLHFTT
ncbi:MAG: S-adenosylmethionine:tRNA ribosyltransferase-isomerase, partial [Candidatus Sericytochromatia bacterium]